MLLAKEKTNYHGFQEPASQPKKIKKVRTKKKRKLKNKRAFIFVSVVVAAFIFAILMATQYVSLAATGYAIVNKKNDLEKLKVEHERLQSKYNQLQSLDLVENIATTKLGMVSPNTEGFIYLPVESKKGLSKKLTVAAVAKKPISRGGKSQDAVVKVTDFLRSWTDELNKAEGKSLFN